jgi:8-oxo-dGTP pyrophosphatase MutT (NUDIX family)
MLKSFPYDEYFSPVCNHWSTLYRFYLPDDPRPHGLMLAATVQKMPWTEDFKVNHETRTVRVLPLNPDGQLATCTVAFSRLVQRCIDEGTFYVIHGQHSEPYPIMGSKFHVTLERYASTLFGIISRGAHLTAYTMTTEGMKIWVPRRSPHLFTYPNCLDTTVAGGVAAGESPYECIVREANEEASLDEEYVRNHAKAVGCISYIGLNDSRGGGEAGLISPDIMYLYDLELPEDVICRQNDEEVKEFSLMAITEVKEFLARAEFKKNSALVMIDFFIRHGIITSEEEEHYGEILSRLHRRLPLPTSPN